MTMARTDPARSAVLDVLSDAIDRFHRQEKDHRKHGRIALAEGTHAYLAWVQRAYKAEFGKQDDPKVVTCDCLLCAWVDSNPLPRKMS